MTLRPGFRDLTLSDVATRMVKLANESGESVEDEFNTITITAEPGESRAAIIRRYEHEQKRREKEHKKSPKYRRVLREYRAKERHRKEMLKIALDFAPPKITLRDKKSWGKWIDGATGRIDRLIPYHAERWARIMESCVVNGETLEACMEETRALVGPYLRTYGHVVSVHQLSRSWIHGKELLRLYHLKFYDKCCGAGVVDE